MILFEYEKTKLEDGYYVVQVTDSDGLELVVAEYHNGSWLQCGIDYDVWRSGYTAPDIIQVIARVDLSHSIASLELL